MNKEYIVRKNEEISHIVKTGKKNISKFFIIYNIESEKKQNQYCISVSKKLGKAHIRNKMKRRIKDILMKNKMELSRKYVIILRKEALNASYNELKDIIIKQIKGETK
jgi:ribonuclease P protein component